MADFKKEEDNTVPFTDSVDVGGDGVNADDGSDVRKKIEKFEKRTKKVVQAKVDSGLRGRSRTPRVSKGDGSEDKSRSSSSISADRPSWNSDTKTPIARRPSSITGRTVSILDNDRLTALFLTTYFSSEVIGYQQKMSTWVPLVS